MKGSKVRVDLIAMSRRPKRTRMEEDDEAPMAAAALLQVLAAHKRTRSPAVTGGYLCVRLAE